VASLRSSVPVGTLPAGLNYRPGSAGFFCLAFLTPPKFSDHHRVRNSDVQNSGPVCEHDIYIEGLSKWGWVGQILPDFQLFVFPCPPCEHSLQRSVTA